MKKIVTLLCSLILIVTCFSFVACDSDDGKDVASTPTSYVTLDINPSVELVTDENDIVVSIYAANEDAEVLLYEEKSIVGLSIEDAVNKILDLAVEYGYLTEENRGVATSIISTSEEEQAALLKKIKDKVESKNVENIEINIQFTDEESFSIKMKKDQLDIKYKDMPAGHIKLIEAAMDVDEDLTFDEAAEMKIGDLLKKIQSVRKASQELRTQTMIEAKKEALATYNAAVDSAKAVAFSLAYVQIKPLYYANAAKYAVSAVGSIALTNLVNTIEAAANYSIPENYVTELAGELGITDVSVLKDSNGNITVDSVSKYLDKTFKNLSEEARTELEAKYEEIINQLKSAETEIIAQMNTLQQEEINKIVAAINELTEKCSSYRISLSDCGLTDLDPEHSTLEDIKAWIETLNTTRDGAMEAMLETLTEDEKKNIAAAQETAVSRLTSELNAYKDAIKNANETAKQSIQQMKQQRKG